LREQVILWYEQVGSIIGKYYLDQSRNKENTINKGEGEPCPIQEQGCTTGENIKSEGKG
jgi:hypothetical protein